MAVVSNRRSVITLFSNDTCPNSHRVRIVLAEKGVSVDIVSVGSGEQPEDLIELNPYGTVPTLMDRDLVLYDAKVIMEYLDERFPHPPLMPVDPVNRARSRLAMYRIERDWYGLVPDLDSKEPQQGAKARRLFRDSLTASAEVFSAKPFFLSDEFSLVDCAIAPLLWRLPGWGIKLPVQARAIGQYADRVFALDSFKASLTEAEREMGV
jgi:RNA polymerase-associated protein